ncbi:hypothetical protein RA279_28365, partial [Pseudomonas syringae pv. tagetis]
LYRRINLRHIILLHAGTFFPAVPTEAPLAAVNIHAVKEKLRHRISRALCALGKCLYKHRRVAFPAGTSVQYHNFLTHRNHSLPLKSFPL